MKMNQYERYSINEKLEIISQLAQEKKAENCILLDVEGISNIIDKLLICSGEGTIHTRAIGKYIMEETKKMTIKMHHQEGIENGKWILLDFGDIIIHIFDKTTREYYKLEELWNELIKSPKAHIND